MGFDVVMIWEKLKIAVASKTIPSVIIHFGPILLESNPARGAVKKSDKARGRNVIPLLIADNPLTTWKYSERKKMTANSPMDTIETVMIPYRNPGNFNRPISNNGSLPFP